MKSSLIILFVVSLMGWIGIFGLENRIALLQAQAKNTSAAELRARYPGPALELEESGQLTALRFVVAHNINNKQIAAFLKQKTYCPIAESGHPGPPWNDPPTYSPGAALLMGEPRR